MQEQRHNRNTDRRKAAAGMDVGGVALIALALALMAFCLCYMANVDAHAHAIASEVRTGCVGE